MFDWGRTVEVGIESLCCTCRATYNVVDMYPDAFVLPLLFVSRRVAIECGLLHKDMYQRPMQSVVLNTG